MNKEELQYKLENIVERKNELIKRKETFKADLEKLFVDFKNDSFNPLYDQLKQKIIIILDDYKINAETKLDDAKGEVNTALLNMKSEIDTKLKEAEESYKLKQENLKAKINIQKEKIGSILIENNILFRNSTLKNNTIKNKEIEIKEIVGPTSISISAFSFLSATIFAFIETTGLGAIIEVATIAGFTFAGIGAIIGAGIGLAGFGGYKAWRYFHKKDDLIELVDKAKRDFMIKYENFYKEAKNLLDEDKKKIIDSFCNSIDNYISKIENAVNEMEK